VHDHADRVVAIGPLVPVGAAAIHADDGERGDLGCRHGRGDLAGQARRRTARTIGSASTTPRSDPANASAGTSLTICNTACFSHPSFRRSELMTKLAGS
jgi:hypothetical protein